MYLEASVDSKISERPGHLINRASRLFLRWCEERFDPLGLGVAQVPVLYALKDGNFLTQTELARLARIEQPTMAQLLGRMERDGLIRRSENPADRRSSFISLTPRALKKLPRAKEVLEQGNAIALRGFTSAEAQTLHRLLRRVVDNLDPDRAK
jgi:MarR family transcriptional regulator for hemolysin